jgi:hypothetical protein
MTKYEELRDAYVAARTSFFARRDKSAAFAAKLVQGMETYLASPMFQLHFMPHTGDAASLKASSADTAIWLGADDRWHFRVGLPLTDRVQGVSKGGSTQTLLFEMHLFPEGDGFNIGIAGWPERFTLPATPGTPEHQAFYGFVFEKMIEVYRKPGLKFFDNMADTQRPITGER